MTKPVTRAMAVNCLLERVILQIGTPLLCSVCGLPMLPEEKIQFDHVHADVHDGPHAWEDLRPIHYDPCHKRKTKTDVQAKAKGDRILGLTCNGPTKPIPSRPFPKGQRKMQSRPFQRAAIFPLSTTQKDE